MKDAAYKQRNAAKVKLKYEISRMVREEGEALVADLMLRNPSEYATLGVGTAMGWIEFWDEARVKLTCAKAGIKGNTQLADLAPQERIRLATLLRLRVVEAHEKTGWRFGKKIAA